MYILRVLLCVDDKQRKMAYVFAVIVLIVALVCSGATAICSVVVGGNIKGTVCRSAYTF